MRIVFKTDLTNVAAFANVHTVAVSTDPFDYEFFIGCAMLHATVAHRLALKAAKISVNYGKNLPPPVGTSVTHCLRLSTCALRMRKDPRSSVEIQPCAQRWNSLHQSETEWHSFEASAAAD